MSPLTPSQFCSLDSHSKVSYLADICGFLELDWEDTSKRGKWLKTLRAHFEIIAKDSCEDLKYITRLAPVVKGRMTLQDLFTVIVPVERFLTKGKSFPEVSEEDKTSPVGDAMPLTVILDNIRSAFNVGSIFRSCETLGVSKVFLCGYSSGPDNKQTCRAAMGTQEHIDWEWKGRSLELIQELQGKGIPIFGLETAESGKNIFETDLPQGCALLLGNERFGLSGEILNSCTSIIRIPVFGRKNSLNVANAFSVCAYEIRRKWRGMGEKSV